MPAPADALDIAHLIQTAVAPVFLLSGIATTLNVLMGRLARIVDRARLIEVRPVVNREQALEVEVTLGVLARRTRYINGAILLTTVSGLLVAMTVVLLFANALTHLDLSTTIACVFVAALLALVAALVLFLIEARIATASLRFGKPTGYPP